MKRMSVTIAAVAIHQLSFKEIFIETNESRRAPDKTLVSTVSAMIAPQDEFCLGKKGSLSGAVKLYHG